MKNIKLYTLLLFVSITAACAGTSVRVEMPYKTDHSEKLSYDIVKKVSVSDKAMRILKDQLDLQLKNANLMVSSSEQASKAVEITITNYYMRHGANRALVGSMAGSDRLHSTVIVRDIESKEVVGKYTVISKNPTAWGSSRGLIREHANEIVNILK